MKKYLKLDTDLFIKLSKEIHDNKYDYSLTKYINARTKVKIICPIHGIFEQMPHNHFRTPGCLLCTYDRVTQDEFINKCKIKHNNKYDYSLTKYINARTKVKIICPIHGIFEQIANNHLNSGHGCFKCSCDNQKDTLNEFIQKSIKIHGDKYDYSLVIYVNNHTNVKIICPIHGIFEQQPNSHIEQKCGCNKCKIDERIIRMKNKFLKESIKHHGNKYDYSLVDYIDSRLKVKIICPIHGIFEQVAKAHYCGSGCPMCNEPKGEKKIRIYLIENNINFIRQKTFKGCKNTQVLQFDFYLPDYNMCIEFDGKQHFESIEFFGGIKTFELLQYCDKIKSDYCKDNGIKLLRISYKDNVNEMLQNYFNI